MTGIICFIILHYITIDETVACVESIKKMKLQDDIRIVIVDNASPNHSGRVLKEKYDDDFQVQVILQETNAGFSSGNNAGCLYAKGEWNPFFYVVVNNDVVFTQDDFCEKLFAEYKKAEYDVLGMDIYCPTKKKHQSPLAGSLPDIRDVNKTILVNTIMLKFFELLYPLIELYYKRLDKMGYDAVDYNKYQENVCVMGACIVLSRKYMSKREKPFLPETGFYYEEFLLFLWCSRNAARVVYQPNIKVMHNEGAATKQMMKSYKDKIKFRIENIVDSAKVFRKELKG